MNHALKDEPSGIVCRESRSEEVFKLAAKDKVCSVESGSHSRQEIVIFASEDKLSGVKSGTSRSHQIIKGSLDVEPTCVIGRIRSMQELRNLLSEHLSLF